MQPAGEEDLKTLSLKAKDKGGECLYSTPPSFALLKQELLLALRLLSTCFATSLPATSRR